MDIGHGSDPVEVARWPTAAQGWDDGVDGVRHHRRHRLFGDVLEGARPSRQPYAMEVAKVAVGHGDPAVGLLAVYLNGPCYQVPSCNYTRSYHA